MKRISMFPIMLALLLSACAEPFPRVASDAPQRVYSLCPYVTEVLVGLRMEARLVDSYEEAEVIFTAGSAPAGVFPGSDAQVVEIMPGASLDEEIDNIRFIAAIMGVAHLGEALVAQLAQ